MGALLIRRGRTIYRLVGRQLFKLSRPVQADDRYLGDWPSTPIRRHTQPDIPPDALEAMLSQEWTGMCWRCGVRPSAYRVRFTPCLECKAKLTEAYEQEKRRRGVRYLYLPDPESAPHGDGQRRGVSDARHRGAAVASRHERRNGAPPVAAMGGFPARRRDLKGLDLSGDDRGDGGGQTPYLRAWWDALGVT